MNSTTKSQTSISKFEEFFQLHTRTMFLKYLKNTLTRDLSMWIIPN